MSQTKNVLGRCLKSGWYSRGKSLTTCDECGSEKSRAYWKPYVGNISSCGKKCFKACEKALLKRFNTK